MPTVPLRSEVADFTMEEIQCRILTIQRNNNLVDLAVRFHVAMSSHIFV
jgi:hypothetical protein